MKRDFLEEQCERFEYAEGALDETLKAQEGQQVKKLGRRDFDSIRYDKATQAQDEHNQLTSGEKRAEAALAGFGYGLYYTGIGYGIGYAIGSLTGNR